MYATVRTYSAAPELADALAARADDVRSTISGIDGFRAYYLIRTADGAVSVSVFDTAAGAEESVTAAAAFLRENMPGLVSAPPQIASGDVVISG